MKFTEFIIKLLIITTLILEIITLKKTKRQVQGQGQCKPERSVCTRHYEKQLNECCEPSTCVNWHFDKKIRGWGYFNEKSKMQGTCTILIRRKVKKMKK